MSMTTTLNKVHQVGQNDCVKYLQIKFYTQSCLTISTATVICYTHTQNQQLHRELLASSTHHCMTCTAA